MIIQDQDRTHIYNSNGIICMGIVQHYDDSKWYIAFENDLSINMSFNMAVYSTKERAQYELDNLITAFARDAKVYVMPEE